MPNYLDLHLHSHYSGGALSCHELIKKARANNIKVLALTDHNTIAGVKEMVALGKKSKIKIIPGVELYTTFGGKNFHILGYHIDLDNLKLNQVLKNLLKKRRLDTERALKKLISLGFQINLSYYKELKNKYIDLGQIIGVLYQSAHNRRLICKECKSANPDLFTIINRYFAIDGLAPLPETSIPAERAIKLIKQAGGISVLAHPGQQLLWTEDYLIVNLKKNGLNGLEVLSPAHTWHQIGHYQYLAKKYKLIMTAGSDFHGDLPGAGPIKNQWDYFKISYSLNKYV